MKEYHKIETLFVRDEKTFKVVPSQWKLPEFAYLAENYWVWTEKVDGTNIRIMWDGEHRQFGGKTDNAQIPAFLVQRLDDLFPSDKLKAIFPDVSQACLYGEGYGARIQKGGGNYKADGVDFVLFDVKVGEWWLERPNVLDIAARLNLHTVPIVGVGSLSNAAEYAKVGFKSEWGNFPAEGLVVRPATELRTRSGHRIIGKIKHNDFAKL